MRITSSDLLQHHGLIRDLERSDNALVRELCKALLDAIEGDGEKVEELNYEIKTLKEELESVEEDRDQFERELEKADDKLNDIDAALLEDNALEIIKELMGRKQ